MLEFDAVVSNKLTLASIVGGLGQSCCLVMVGVLAATIL